jgi:hypothetical protein
VIYKKINYQYYGFKDEEDDDMLRAEAEAERISREKAVSYLI